MYICSPQGETVDITKSKQLLKLEQKALIQGVVDQEEDAHLDLNDAHLDRDSHGDGSNLMDGLVKSETEEEEEEEVSYHAVQCLAVCCSSLWCVAVCGSVLQCVAVWARSKHHVAMRYASHD